MISIRSCRLCRCAWIKAACPVLLVSFSSLAMEVGAGLGLSTLGFNFHLGTSFNEYFGGEADFALAKFDREGQLELNDENLNYGLKAQFAEIGVLGHFHPFKGSFRLSAGVYGNETKIQFDIQPSETKVIGSLEFTPEEQGKLQTVFDFPNAAPYLGIGFGKPAGNEGLSFLVDLGVLYHGAPRISMKGSGLIEPTAENAPQLEETFKKHGYTHFYPVFAIGIGMPAF